MKGERKYLLPFQYGYGDQYISEAKAELIRQKELPGSNIMASLWTYCRESAIILRTSKTENCKQRELKNLSL
jgi:hypothetical protein